MIKVAATELADFFYEATGWRLGIINDKNKIFSEESKYLSIGKTTLFYQTGLVGYDGLGNSGTQIATVGKSVFMFGDSDYGSLYAVYDFLTELFGFEYYGKGCYTIGKNVKTIPLKRYNRINIPDFEYRAADGYTESSDVYELYRLRKIDWYTGFFTPIKTLPWHNAAAFLEDYDEGHEAYWYSTDGSQVCFTAHGDKDEYEAMLDAALKSAIKALKENPHTKSLNCSINDSHTYCSCAACSELLRQYGNKNVVSNILFCNDLKKKVDEWFETEEGSKHKRDLTVSFFAYMSTEEAPAEYNSQTGKYEPINGIHCDEGVVVYFAPIYCDFTRAITDPINKDQYANFVKWKTVSDDIYVWLYDWNFQSYYTPYDTFSSVQSYYKLCRELGVTYFFNEGPVAQKYDYSSWNTLKSYLNAKLAWDADSDVEQLIKNFCNAYFEDAGEIMYKILDDFRILSAYLKETDPTYGGSFSCQKSNVKESLWPKMYLMDALKKYDEAISALSNIRNNDPERYEVLYNRIALERVSPLYLTIKLYNWSFSPDELMNYRNLFKSDTSRFNIGANYGYDDISVAYMELGIV